MRPPFRAASVPKGGLVFAPLLTVLGACSGADDVFCETDGCVFSAAEWSRVKSLSGLGPPPADRSNKYVASEAAAALGQKFYFDARFSGPATGLDTIRRVASGRAPKGQPVGVSCATCHDPARAGADFTSVPNTVSRGAGVYDVNGQQTVNAAHYRFSYWNARNDSLWAQVIAVNESFVSMNSTRLRNAWVIQDLYRAEYDAAFGDAHPMPLSGTSADVAGLVETTGPRAGQCKLVDGACPTDAGCREVEGLVGPTCWPRFPLEGKPGALPGCQAPLSTEPAGDAFDCMADEDKVAVNRVFANFAKAIAAYETRLVSTGSHFDDFVAAGPTSTFISESARRGARLFVGKASCIDCHSGPLLSDDGFHDIGVPQAGDGVPTLDDCPKGGVCDCTAKDPTDPASTSPRNCLPWGVWDGLGKLQTNPWTRASAYSDLPKTERDEWAAFLKALPRDEDLKGAWRTPSLRDIARTAPYMHDGFYRTLEDVVWHYAEGGTGAGVGKPAVQIKPLALTAVDRADLVAFLRTLDGRPPDRKLATAPELPR